MTDAEDRNLRRGKRKGIHPHSAFPSPRPPAAHSAARVHGGRGSELLPFLRKMSGGIGQETSEEENKDLSVMYIPPSTPSPASQSDHFHKRGRSSSRPPSSSCGWWKLEHFPIDLHVNHVRGERDERDEIFSPTAKPHA